MKGELKMKSKMKWVGLFGLVLSAFSIFIHFLLARFTQMGAADFESSITIFSWRPIFEKPIPPTNSPSHRRLWGPVKRLESLYPDSNPQGNYADPVSQTNGFIFVRIRGGFHEIRNSICDVVVVARLLNATLAMPEILSTTSSKGISSQFKSFAYLYNEEQFVLSLAKDVTIVRTLPKDLKGARRKKEIPVFRVPYSASPFYYFHHVLPVLKSHSVVELVVSEGGCLKATLPPDFEEYQRLRCRVSFHALKFRQEVQELSAKILQRLRAPGRPFIAFDPGMTRESLAYHGCAELFQDVHTELIQHKRSWMLKRGIVKGKLSINSAEERLKGSCPLMPEEIGTLLRAYGYSRDTIIYVSGGEVFGGQRTLIPLHSMFENVIDRTSLSTPWEMVRLYGQEVKLVETPGPPPFTEEVTKRAAWKNAGPRPRPLPPPPARPKSYNIEGWWGWVAESDNEPDSTVMELRTNAHKLLWEAIDYVICVEADVFIPGFDLDGKGHPNFASLVMGHRLYQSATSKTFRPDRKEAAKLLDEIRQHMHHANHTWLESVRRHLTKTLLDGIIEASSKSKLQSFLSHPVPECSCLRRDSFEVSKNSSSPSTSQLWKALSITRRCPAWMDSGPISLSKDKESEEVVDEDDSVSELFFGQSAENHEGEAEVNNKEENHCCERALNAFGLDPKCWGVNVQPYSCTSANFAVYTGLLLPGDRIMGLDTPSGGNTSHGYYTPNGKKVSGASIFFESLPYKVNPQTGYIDYDKLEERALDFRPKILICGGSSYPREWDYARFRHIADKCGAVLLCDMAQISGIIAAKECVNPFDYCDIVTSTTHKSLRGPRGGIIFYRKGSKPRKRGILLSQGHESDQYDYEEKINFAVFPSLQGGPHNNHIAALAIALKQVATPEYKAYMQQVKKNAQALACALQRRKCRLVTGGTDNHLILWDLRPLGLTGKFYEKVCEACHITLNKIAIFGDNGTIIPGGVRVGTPAMTSRGCLEPDFETMADFLIRAAHIASILQREHGKLQKTALKGLESNRDVVELRARVEVFAIQFAMPGFDI